MERNKYYKDVGEYYDPQEQSGNINYELSKGDKIFHHHSGICLPTEHFSTSNEGELHALLHSLENNLTLVGSKYLGKVRGGMTGLDAGCGRGGSSILLNKELDVSMYGVTLSIRQAEFANNAAAALGKSEKLLFMQSNMIALPFETEVFDFVWACESTEHVPNLSEMYAEFSRVTKPEASLVIIAACGVPSHPEGPKYISRANEWYHMLVHSREEYAHAAVTNGWDINEIVDLTPNTIPYWDLRTKSSLKTGVEELVEGYRIGAGEYLLFSLQKKTPSKV